MLENKKIHIDVSEDTRKFLAEQGFDVMYGARPLKRVIQRLLLNPLSKLVLEGRVLENDKVNLLVCVRESLCVFCVKVLCVFM